MGEGLGVRALVSSSIHSPATAIYIREIAADRREMTADIREIGIDTRATVADSRETAID